ncbi:BSP-domain-containing protein [Ramaria rubella]|nr:BSP-domain-containing protein [Ramaria rubella]
MSFSQLKYSEKRAEKDALVALLDEYFSSRTVKQCGPSSNLSKDNFNSTRIKSTQTPEKKPKPPVPSIIPYRPTVSASASTPLPPGPPPINRNTRPSETKLVPPVLQLPSPPPLETSNLWADIIPRFDYPPADHSASGIDLFHKYIPYPINELHSAAISIFNILYPDSDFKPKNVKSPVKLIMRDMEGVAHAANSMSYSGELRGQSFSNVFHGSDFVFSTKYLGGLEHHSDPAFEIRGIILHELTHTFQFSAENTPGGLIEGIADFVRLRGEHGAKHWAESPVGKKWDQGYETTAYFLDWADKNIYEGLVTHINAWLGKNKTYNELQMFNSVMPGWSWDVLWEQYLASR